MTRLLNWLRSSKRRSHPLQAQVEALAKEREELITRLAALEAKERTRPARAHDNEMYLITVGGREVELQNLDLPQWNKAIGEIPDFLLWYSHKQTRPDPSDTPEDLKRLEDLITKVRGYIRASAVSLEGVRLERLNVSEAMDALTKISVINGFDARLADWFRERLGPGESRSGGAALRRPAERVN